MSGTDLDITLSQALRTELDQPGVYAYAEVFGTLNNGGTLPSTVTLVSNGTISNDGTFSIPLTPSPATQLKDGKVYLVIQSLPAGTPSTLPSVITNQSSITPDNATTYDFGYDSIEVTLAGTDSDAANLTSVNGFGLPMELSTEYDNGTSASVGYNISGGAIASSIGSITNGGGIATFSEGPLAGDFRLSTSPTEANQGSSGTPSTGGPFPQAAWLPYIEALETITNDTITNASPILIAGQFNGAPDADGDWHNGGYYAYQLQWDAAEGVFWLAPAPNSQIQGYIKLTPDDIAENAYSQVGSVTIYASETAVTPFATISVGDNDQWGAVLAQFLTGFTGGYYGEVGDPINQQTTATVDLNENFNWDPTYAFGAKSTSTLDLPAGTQTNDPYSQLFFENSNSYGSPYSDALMSQYSVGGPLLSVSEPGSSTDVGTIDLTLYADSDSPGGYVQPKIYNDIQPTSPAAGYAVPTPNSSGANIVFNFFSAVANNAGISLDPNTTITLSILTGDTNSVPSWSTVTFDGADTTNGLGLWQQWQISGSAGTGYTATAAGTPQPTGSLQILGFPTAINGVSWYQITVGTGADAKTYNLYTTTDSDGQFLNPSVPGQQQSVQIDGLAQIAGPTGPTAPVDTPTFTVSFVRGDTVTYNPALVVENSGTAAFPGKPVPTAPVIGTIGQDGTFTDLPGQNSDGVGPSPDYTVTPVDVTTSIYDGLSAGWTGLNTTLNTVGNNGSITGPVNGYTNKTNPDDFAVITVENSIGQFGTITAVADLDGEWHTQAATVSLGDGTYTVTMQDALPVMSNGTLVPGAPVTAASAPVYLTIEDSPVTAGSINIEDVPCFRTGTLIATPSGEIPVEALRPGDAVITIDGAEEIIVWLGHRQVDCARHPEPERVWPVRIAAHAFAPARPARDLFLSPDHAVFAEGALIPVKHLLDGLSVSQVPVESVTYVHIELERHAVIRAEGLPAETYLDTGDRRAFANGGGATMLHPAWGREALDTALIMDAMGYAPLQVKGPAVERTRALLAGRAQLRAQASAQSCAVA